MDDKVGSKVPSDKDVQKVVDEITKLEGVVKPYTVTLSADDRKHTTKFRPGGDEVVQTISRLAKKHGVTLPKISVDGMNADLTLAQRLRPLAAAVEALKQRIDDTILEAESECWWATTAYYGALARITDADAGLEAELSPVVEFFALGPRKKKPTPPAK